MTIDQPLTSKPLTRASIFAQAWPIMLGQASIPLVGVVDAVVIGRTGDTAALAGVALGATIISLIFWSFGFLRMGMTGLTAQAEGAGDKSEVEALLLRALLLGFCLGAAIFALQWPISATAFAILSGSEAVTLEANAYVSARFIGAPAALCVFAINGWMLGLGRTKEALALQVVMNIANIVLDVWFVWGLGMGAEGVGYGTAGAEWIALVCGLLLCARIAKVPLPRLFTRTPKSRIADPAALKKLFAVNRDIMIRTFALLIMFTWFANAGARIGATELAANHVLMQFINLAAFVLDAFAFTAESRVGNAIGARSKPAFLRSIRLAGEFCLGAGVLLAGLFLLAGPAAIAFITTDDAIRQEAVRFLPFAALVPIVGMPSWMLDGIFIGATRGKALRNAGVAAALLYLLLDFSLRPFDNMGVWVAITASYILRAGALACFLPSLLRSIEKRPVEKALDDSSSTNSH